MYITRTGMVCAVGLNAASACAAMRAGIANFVELPYHDNQGEPIIGALVPGVRRDLLPGASIVRLLSNALAQCLPEKLPQKLDKVPLLLGLGDSWRPGGSSAGMESLLEQVQQKLGMGFHPTFSKIIATGHTAGFESLMVARDLLKISEVPACVVAATDSYINRRSLGWLESLHRLKTVKNSDGLIPGEGAAALWLQMSSPPNTTFKVQVIGMGFGEESASVLKDDPLLGMGLAEATRCALVDSRLQLHDIDFRISDATGESYGFRELSLAEARLLRVRKESFPLWQLADAIGDVGAAAGIAEMVVAWHSFSKGYSAERTLPFPS